MGRIEIPPIGDRLRAERLRQGRSLRALAREAGVSASLVSQIENGRIRPSVSTLYAVTGALGLPVADLLEAMPSADTASSATSSAGSPVSTAGLAAMLERNPVTTRQTPGEPDGRREPAGRDAAGSSSPAVEAVTVPGEREVITLDSGVVWEVLGGLAGERVDFLRITYEPNSASSSGELMSHPGSEYGFLLSGSLVMQLGDDERRLSPGDAVSFRSGTPHRYRNDGPEPAVAIWMVIDDV
jgi:transcriptional regulator with XRE-family HTH domain/quercetin dioxygenase-like cupin family protein